MPHESGTETQTAMPDEIFPGKIFGQQAPLTPGADMHWPLAGLDETAFLIFLKVFSYLFLAFLLGLVVAEVYYLTSNKEARRTDRSFLTTLVLLSVLICLVTLVIGDNIARAFSLAGALAIIRFRTVVDDTRDTAFVIFAVASGMSVGAGYVLAPIACVPLVLAGGWMFRPKRAGPGEKSGVLQLRLGAGRMPGPEAEALIKSIVGDVRLVEMGTARGGAALDVKYAIRVPRPEQVVALVTALSQIEGILAVEVKEN